MISFKKFPRFDDDRVECKRRWNRRYHTVLCRTRRRHDGFCVLTMRRVRSLKIFRVRKHRNCNRLCGSLNPLKTQQCPRKRHA